MMMRESDETTSGWRENIITEQIQTNSNKRTNKNKAQVARVIKPKEIVKMNKQTKQKQE